MKKITNVLESIEKYEFSVIAARPLHGRIPITMEFIYHYAIENHKKILLFSLDGHEDFYLSFLIARISGLSISQINEYIHPCSYRRNNDPIDRNKFVDALEILQKSNLYINDYPYVTNDYLDYLLEYNDLESFDFIIINSLEEFVNCSKYEHNIIYSKLRESCRKHNSHILYWNSVNENIEINKNRDKTLSKVNNYNVIKDYIDNFIICYNKNGDKIELANYSNDKKDRILNLSYDWNTGIAIEIE